MKRSEQADLGPRRKLRRGDIASVKLPGRTTRVKAKFLYVDDDGNLTFADPRNGGLRTITPDAVGPIHRERR